MLNSMNTHQVLAIVIVDARVLGCVADSLQERRFPSIGPTDYKDTKASIFHSEIVGRIQNARRRRRARVEIRCKGVRESGLLMCGLGFGPAWRGGRSMVISVASIALGEGCVY